MKNSEQQNTQTQSVSNKQGTLNAKNQNSQNATNKQGQNSASNKQSYQNAQNCKDQ